MLAHCTSMPWSDSAEEIEGTIGLLPCRNSPVPLLAIKPCDTLCDFVIVMLQLQARHPAPDALRGFCLGFTDKLFRSLTA